MKRSACFCDGGDGEFCFLCTPSLCEEKTLEEAYASLMTTYRSLYTDIGLTVANCKCAGRSKRCARCKELEETLEVH